MITPVQALKKHFGYDSFLPDQEEIIDLVLAGKDSVAVMPTGSGKSIIYQLPALLLDGLTIVVSPLIALMKDQVESLHQNGIKATYINSMLTTSESNEIIQQLEEEKFKLLYVAPERLLSEQFLSLLEKLQISLIAIDEAHCISSWGHDFRPEYSKLSLLKKIFPKVPMIALTATADRITRKDIIKQLNLINPEVRVASFNRPNLSLSVLPGVNRYEVIRAFIDGKDKQCGIIYCLSRKSTEELSGKLQKDGISAVHYHAGMPRKERENAQDSFISDEVQVICATIAFGMGIDKSNVRWIIHYNMPKSLENYYQEIGRAGRDGLPSQTMMFYSFRDVILLRQFAEDSGQPEIQLDKLQRMQQYAEAISCRRKVLLSYFNEFKEEDCGNCDVCENPPDTFDGTVIAQKALSAIVRLNENVASGILIDVLRGSGKREIMEMNYQQIKTYGAGRDLSYFDWQHYLLQLLHLGLFDIAYNDNRKLKLSPLGKKVLFEGKKIMLVRPVYAKERKAQTAAKVKKLTKKERLKQDLTEILQKLRKDIAAKENVPPYIIFNDKSLEELAEKRPSFPKELLAISGFGEHKTKKYGSDLLEIITEFKIANKDRASTSLYTYQLLNQGKSINEIAQMRKLNVLTVTEHLITIYENRDDFDIFKHIPDFNGSEIVAYINEYIESQGESPSNKIIFDHFRGRFEYHQIRIGYAMKKKGDA